MIWNMTRVLFRAKLHAFKLKLPDDFDWLGFLGWPIGKAYSMPGPVRPTQPLPQPPPMPPRRRDGPAEKLLAEVKRQNDLTERQVKLLEDNGVEIVKFRQTPEGLVTEGYILGNDAGEIQVVPPYDLKKKAIHHATGCTHWPPTSLKTTEGGTRHG